MWVRNWMSWMVIAICAPVAMTACAVDVDDRAGDHDVDEQTDAVPGVVELGPTGVDSDVRVPDTTRVLAKQARAALRSYDDITGTLVFSRRSAGALATAAHEIADPARLRVGDIVVSQPTRAAPYGMMRRVTGVSVEANGVEVTTAEAQIGDAIEQADVHLDLPLAGGTLAKLVPEANVEVTTRHVQTDAFLGVGYDILDWNWSLAAGYDFGTGGACTLTEATVVHMEAKARLGLTVTGFNVSDFGVTGTASATSKASIICGAGSHSSTKTLAAYWTQPTWTSLGGVPLVYQFAIALVGGVDQSGKVVGLTAQWSENYTAKLGWQNGKGWGPDLTHSVTQPTLNVNGSGTLRLKAGPVFVLSMYASAVFSVYSWVDIQFTIGATGTIYALPFLEITSSVNPFSGTITGTLYGGMESAGAAGAVIDITTFLFLWPIIDFNRAWTFGRVFPEIKKKLYDFSICHCN